MVKLSINGFGTINGEEVHSDENAVCPVKEFKADLVLFDLGVRVLWLEQSENCVQVQLGLMSKVDVKLESYGTLRIKNVEEKE